MVADPRKSMTDIKAIMPKDWPRLEMISKAIMPKDCVRCNLPAALCELIILSPNKKPRTKDIFICERCIAKLEDFLEMKDEKS
jgi:hypothetical protein